MAEFRRGILRPAELTEEIRADAVKQVVMLSAGSFDDAPTCADPTPEPAANPFLPYGSRVRDLLAPAGTAGRIVRSGASLKRTTAVTFASMAVR
jgi:hypothetical protein